MENDIARLQCFDSAESVESIEENDESEFQSPPIELEKNAVWERREEKDPISDRRNVSYFGLPLEGQKNMFGMPKSVFFQLRCSDNTTAVVLYFDDYQINDVVKLAVRIDENPALDTRWAIASNRQAAGLWRGNEAIPFIKSLLGSTSLTLRAFLKDGTETYKFDTSKVGEYAADIAEACSWQLN